MTTSEPSRLDRIEMLLGTLAERQEISKFESTARLEHIKQPNENTTRLIESNARAIAAHGEEVRTSLAEVVNMVGGVAVQRQAEQAAGDLENALKSKCSWVRAARSSGSTRRSEKRSQYSETCSISCLDHLYFTHAKVPHQSEQPVNYKFPRLKQQGVSVMF